MKTLKISNGEIRLGYELNDLSPLVKNHVIAEHCEFLDSQDLDFEHDYKEAAENIELNGYLFDEAGELLPVTSHVKGGEVWKTTFSYGKIEHTVEFI